MIIHSLSIHLYDVSRSHHDLGNLTPGDTCSYVNPSPLPPQEQKLPGPNQFTPFQLAPRYNYCEGLFHTIARLLGFVLGNERRDSAHNVFLHVFCLGYIVAPCAICTGSASQ